MNIREFGKPVTAKSLNESLAAKFGQKINLERFTLEQLQDARNKLRTKLSQVETMESFDSVQNTTYQKSKLMIDVLNAAIAERGDVDGDVVNETNLREGEEDKAELVMAAKDMVEKLTSWMEDTAEMQTQSMLELADSIRDELGQEASEAFVNTVKPALDTLYGAMETTRTALTSGVGQLTGEGAPTDTLGNDDELGDIDGGDDMDMGMDGGDTTGVDAIDMDMGMGADDEFGAAAAATGGEEPADRAKRESVHRPKKKSIAETVLKKLRANESFDPMRLTAILSKKK